MARGKQKTPGRLPAARGGSGVLALSAYAVRMEASAEQLDPFGSMQDEEDWLVPDHHESCQDAPEDVTEVDGAKAEALPSPFFARYRASFESELTPASRFSEPHVKLTLAVVELDLQNGAAPEGVVQECKLARGEGRLSMVLARKASQPIELRLERHRAKDHKELLFRGSAEYWMGASDDQLQALADSARGFRNYFAAPCELVEREGGKLVLRYSVCLYHHSEAPETIEGALTRTEPSQKLYQWGRKNELIIMEWLFPGSVKRNLAQAAQVLSYDRENHASMRAPQQKEIDPSVLFRRIKPSPEREMLPEASVPWQLVCALRPYQRRAIRWMLEREDFFSNSAAIVDRCRRAFFCSYLAADGSPFLFCPFTAAFLGPNDVTVSETTLQGGILADEMGLGKTVEVLGLVLSNAAGPEQHNADVMSAFDFSTLEAKVANVETTSCLCNAAMEELPGGWIQCGNCGSWQHKLCAWSGVGESTGQGAANANAAEAARVETLASGEVVNADGAPGVHICLTCRANLLTDWRQMCYWSHAVPKPEVLPYAKTTLVVCPASILSQWGSEIAKHTEPNSVSVLVYEGVAVSVEGVRTAREALRRTANKVARGTASEEELKAAERLLQHRSRLLWPQYLGQFDVVLTTYAVLRADLHHVTTHARERGDRRFRLRNKKRYCAPPSPLGSVRWRRVCLDEAQEVENSTAKAAEMALSLEARFRWAITGTPIGQNGLDDLYGLMLFVNAVPLSSIAWWRETVREPLAAGKATALRRLETVFREVLWRNTKRDVRDELQLPGLTEHIHRVAFTPIERHFYAKQHEEVQRKALEQRSAVGDTAASRARTARQQQRQVETVLGPLLRLRQACCHPQIGSFGIRDHGGQRRGKKRRKTKALPGLGEAAGHSAQAPITMGELHKLLVGKARIECEEAQRLLFMNMNAVAGLQVIQDERKEAKATYHSILDLMKKHSDAEGIRSDPLQRLHTLEGLRALLAADDQAARSGNEISTKSLHLDRLANQAREIRDQFMSRYAHDVSAALHAYKAKREATAASAPADVSLPGGGGYDGWWALAIKTLEEQPDGHERGTVLVERMRMDRSSGGALISFNRQQSLVWQFGDLSGLGMVLARELGRTEKAFEAMDAMILRLGEAPSDAEVGESADCSVCRSYFGKRGPICRHCRRKKLISAAEECVFSFDRGERKRSSLRDDQAETEAAADSYQYRDLSETQLLLRVLRSGLKSLRGGQQLARAADAHLAKFQNMAAQLQAAWIVWNKRDAQLKACDELDMATLRIRLQLPEEEVTEEEGQWKIHPAEVGIKREHYDLECARYRAQLRQALSQVRYLNQIKDNQPAAGERLGGTVVSTQTSSDGGLENEACPICHDRFGQKFSVLGCGHSFCLACVAKLRKVTSRCPSCRARFGQKDIRFVTTSATSDPSCSSSSSSSSASPAQQPESAPAAAGARVLVKSGLGSKLDAVLGELLSVERREPEAKCLVFSQWEEVLEIMEHGLALNNVSYMRIQGKHKYNDRLSMFRRDPSVRVLLLPLKSGAKGLNLTEANHVFFTEPICNPAIEAQAIGRVHRMGQKKRSHVHHFVVEDTIEERIHSLFRKKRLNAIRSSERVGGTWAPAQAPGAEDVLKQHASPSQLPSPPEECPAAAGPPGQAQEAAYDTNDVLASEKEQLSIEEVWALFDGGLESKAKCTDSA